MVTTTADLARRVLERFGVDSEEAARSPNGESNAVWMADEIVLRVATAPGPGSLSVEARVAAILPIDVGYPTVIDSGVIDGHEYVVSERLPGVNLGEVWGATPPMSKVAAVDDVWRRLEAIHRADVGQAEAAGARTTPFYALDANAAARQLQALRARSAIPEPLGIRLANILDAGFDAIRSAPLALAHTDVHPGNVVWSAPHAVLVDFEFACVGPADLDLESFCRRFSLGGGQQVRDRLRALLSDPLARPGARKRLVAYAVLFDMWALNRWLDTPQNNGDRPDYESWEPLVRLRGHASGTSWLSELF